MLLQAGSTVRGSSPAAATKPNSSLLLTENQQLISGPPPLMDKLTIPEREIVLKLGRRKVLSRGQTIFSQGAKHDGIFLIESGRIRVFYSSPLGREITLAYWHAGNFVGGPEVFDTGIHQWSGVASSNCSVVQLPGKELRALAVEIPNLAIGLIEGLAFKGKCYSALAQMLGTRSITQRLAHLLLHLMELYGVEDPDGSRYRRSLHACRSGAHGGRDPAMGDDQSQANAKKADCADEEVPDRRLPAEYSGRNARPGIGLSLDAHVSGFAQQNCPTSMQPAFNGN